MITSSAAYSRSTGAVASDAAGVRGERGQDNAPGAEPHHGGTAADQRVMAGTARTLTSFQS